MGPRSYIVCATQRSGSTLLCELLKDTGVAGRPEEYFEARRDTGRPPHPGDFLGDLGGVSAQLREDPTPPEAPPYSSLLEVGGYAEHLGRTRAAGTTPNGVFAAKLMRDQLPELEALAAPLTQPAGLRGAALLAALFDDPAYVWVRRRDTVRQAISMWRALQSRRWRGGLAGAGDHRAPVYDRDAIEHLVARFEREDREWAAFFSDAGIEPLEVGYEDDLERDRTGTVLAVLAHIGVPAPAGWRAPEPLPRQADQTSAEWVRTYIEDAAAAPGSPRPGR